MILFRKKEAMVTCYNYHYFNCVFDPKKTTLDLFGFFENKGIKFEYFSAFDEKYRDYSGKTSRFLTNLSSEKWNILKSIYLFNQENFDSTKIFLKYSMQNPISIFLGFHKELKFSMKELFLVFPRYALCYAYRYDCTVLGLAETYGMGGIENRKRVMNLPPKRLKENIIFRWRTNRDMVLNGFLRDIYLENILTVEQLNRSIGNFSLGEAIVANGWGTLEELSNNSFYWQIGEQQLPDVQKNLYTADIFV